MRSDPPGPQVLHVDDDRDIREVVAEILEAEGFSVHQAEHGVAALELLAAGLRPQVMLLDLMMPVMDGWTLLDHLGRRQELRGIPVVILSATRAAPAVFAVVGKPFELNELVAVVQRCCSRPCA